MVAHNLTLAWIQSEERMLMNERIFFIAGFGYPRKPLTTHKILLESIIAKDVMNDVVNVLCLTCISFL